MILTLFDPRTGAKVTVTVPDAPRPAAAGVPGEAVRREPADKRAAVRPS
jgi:hypothetical protein